jgi:uncharacterized protein
MALRTDTFELERLRLRSGEGRRLDLHVYLEPLQYGGSKYEVEPNPVEARLDVSRTTGNGYSLRLRFDARLHGPCMRCLEPADPTYSVDVREVSMPGAGDELQSPYVDEAADLDLKAWARDALALAVPDQILHSPDCLGLCPECGFDLNQDPSHEHEAPPDPRWAALRDLKLE